MADTPADKALLTMHVSTPQPYRVLSNGDLIREWERQLERDSTRRVMLREYQQAILVGQHTPPKRR